jgi:hypothetical protein
MTSQAEHHPAATITQVVLGGVEVQFDLSGALWVPAHKLLVFSDLHFEKGTSYGRKGVFLPPYDTRATLKAVNEVMARYQPETVISLGDAFHDLEAETRMDEEDARTLELMTSKVDWMWVLGNHDPRPPARFKGTSCEEIDMAGLFFSHEPCAQSRWQVVGHMHPAAKVRAQGRSVRRRCFMTDGERLIMPSFGAYTGGLNILDRAYQPFFPNGFSVFMLGRDQVWQVPRKALCADASSVGFRG